MRSDRGLHPYPSEPNVTAQGEVTPPQWLHEITRQFQRSLGNLSDLIEDTRLRVDEYQVSALSADVGATVQTTPDYELDEIIESIIVTGTPAGTFTLNIGRRAWNLTMSATGIIVIAPVKLSLGRGDTRLLTAGTPGTWTLELMGYCDVRYRVK